MAYRATIADPRIDEVRILRPQEIPVYVADGLFDLGITGRDCIEERGSEVVSLGELSYSKATANPARVVLAVGADSPAHTLAELAATVADRPGRLRVSTEYPELTRRALEAHGIDADIALSYGATEAKVPDIADAVVDMTETGSALRAAGLRVIETLLVSHTELIANPAAAADPDKRHAMEQILTLLQGTLEARGKVLVKLNVEAENLDAVLAVLPSMRAPTISELSGGGAFALEAVVAKSDINILIPALRDQGAQRHPGDPAVQDRPLTWPAPSLPPDRTTGDVASFDPARGLGAGRRRRRDELRVPRHRHRGREPAHRGGHAVVVHGVPGPPRPLRGRGRCGRFISRLILPPPAGIPPGEHLEGGIDAGTIAGSQRSSQEPPNDRQSQSAVGPDHRRRDA